MSIQRVVPVLTVSDLAAATAEHVGVLGLEVVMDLGWVVTLADGSGHQLTLVTRDASAPVNPNVSVGLDDIAAVEASYRSAVDQGLEIVHPLSEEDWGVTRFFYRDSSGSVINVVAHR